MAARWSIDRLAKEVSLLASRGLPRPDYYRELAARLRRTVEFDAACWHTLDPQTLLMTSDAPEELLDNGFLQLEDAPAVGARLVASEYLVDDVNTFAALARRREPVGILSDATRGRPERSARYREVLTPLDIPVELRVALVTRGRVWGALHLARRSGSADFSRADATALARVVGTMAEGLRASIRFDASRRGDDGKGPGLVVLGPVDQVELVTPRAVELLATLRSPARPESDDTPPTPLLALAAFVRAAEDAGPQSHAVAVPTASGWITLHASLPEGRAAGRVAIVLERTATAQSTVLRLEAYGVTPREREIAVLLARGLTNPEIAAELVLSLYTVQDHVKSLFEKTGVASRQELVARIFLDDYWPQIVRQTPIAADGGFVA
ncbi:MAG TPA: helix-turn-helix transcriptional regulator [Gaiellaceae bacterium]|nr:helix-turn-helix transcriptional regulator [Gaiellaceae bacterium]